MEWTPVKDKYPPEDIDVLVLERDLSMSVASLVVWNEEPIKWQRCGPKIVLDAVTHWMFLPPPPNWITTEECYAERK